MYIVNTTEEYDQILKDNKSVFVDFYADWCGPCKMVAPVLESLAPEHANVKFIKVNVDTLPDVAQGYGIMSIPTMLAVKEGQVAASALGFRPASDLEPVIKACE